MNDLVDNVRTYCGDEIRACETLFSPEIDGDPWVHYHATSSISEGQVDSQGLQWCPGVYTAAEALDLAIVCRSMNWRGIHRGGVAVLDGFSVAGDFQGNDYKPIYFREFSLRPLMYAQRDFAGGETARAIRYTLRDLDHYLTDETIREQHYEEQRREALGLVLSGSIPGRVMRVDLQWLQLQVERFADLRRRCDECEQMHRYGVVYAVKFRPDDISSLNFTSFMGLRCYKPIPQEQIVGKARVLADDGRMPEGNDSNLTWPNRWRRQDPKGLLSVLADAERKGLAYPFAAAESALAHQCHALLDPAAGIDDSIEIARVHGSALLVEAVRERRRGRVSESEVS